MCKHLAKAPTKEPVMGLHHEPEVDFQSRTHQSIYLSGRENPAISGFSCCSPDDTAYRNMNGFHGNIDVERKPLKITSALITHKVFHAETSYLCQIICQPFGHC